MLAKVVAFITTGQVGQVVNEYVLFILPCTVYSQIKNNNVSLFQCVGEIQGLPSTTLVLVWMRPSYLFIYSGYPCSHKCPDQRRWPQFWSRLYTFLWGSMGLSIEELSSIQEVCLLRSSKILTTFLVILCYFSSGDDYNTFQCCILLFFSNVCLLSSNSIINIIIDNSKLWKQLCTVYFHKAWS